MNLMSSFSASSRAEAAGTGRLGWRNKGEAQ
jgi:hypothetical protein